MAVAKMGVNHAYTGDGVQILYNSDYAAVAITLDEAVFTQFEADFGCVPAGLPISADGKFANDANAFGILLHDVYKVRPQGTVVYRGAINRPVAEEHSNTACVDAAIAALKGITFIGESKLNMPS
jgi:hypothetical protein